MSSLWHLGAAWSLQVYTGKPDGGAPDKNQVIRVVLDVIQGLRGHNITSLFYFAHAGTGAPLEEDDDGWNSMKRQARAPTSAVEYTEQAYQVL
jgi:hypothetical protein